MSLLQHGVSSSYLSTMKDHERAQYESVMGLPVHVRTVLDCVMVYLSSKNFPNSQQSGKNSRVPCPNSRIPSMYFAFSRIAHCILVKSWIPKIPFQTLCPVVLHFAPSEFLLGNYLFAFAAFSFFLLSGFAIALFHFFILDYCLPY